MHNTFSTVLCLACGEAFRSAAQRLVPCPHCNSLLTVPLAVHKAHAFDLDVEGDSDSESLVLDVEDAQRVEQWSNVPSEMDYVL